MENRDFAEDDVVLRLLEADESQVLRIPQDEIEAAARAVAEVGKRLSSL